MPVESDLSPKISQAGDPAVTLASVNIGQEQDLGQIDGITATASTSQTQEPTTDGATPFWERVLDSWVDFPIIIQAVSTIAFGISTYYLGHANGFLKGMSYRDKEIDANREVRELQQKRIEQLKEENRKQQQELELLRRCVEAKGDKQDN